MKMLVVVLLLTSKVLAQANLGESRQRMVLQALNSKPENWIEPLSFEDVQMGLYEGRVVVNKKSKFTYYLHIEAAEDPQSKMILIPMSTSRYTPTYYQTDEWWNAHKEEIERAKREGRPAPRQDMDEVAAWLKEMKLSANPDVFVIVPGDLQPVRTVPLQDYLLDLHLQHFVEDGKVVLYRGAERPGELNSWVNRQVPRGARYWTPTANYAWRYARKNREFFDLLVQDQTPLFRFEVPVEDFKAMIRRRWSRLTLGAELTKNAHNIFDSARYFGDHLYDRQPFLGWGLMGVEIELRSNRAGAQQMVQYFKRAATMDDLASDRIRVLNRALERLKKQNPDRAIEIESQINQRIEIVRLEAETVKQLINQTPAENFHQNLDRMGRSRGELSYIDGFGFRDWAQEKAKGFEAGMACKDVLSSK